MITIYGIRCLTTGEVYVGSTTRFIERKHEHKYETDCTSKQIIERKNYEFYEIEQTIKEERYIKERYWIEHTANCINKMIPTRTTLEYYYDNIEKRKKYQQQRRITHAEEIKLQRNEIITCECGLSSIRRNIARHRKSKTHLNKV